MLVGERRDAYEETKQDAVCWLMAEIGDGAQLVKQNMNRFVTLSVQNFRTNGTNGRRSDWRRNLGKIRDWRGRNESLT
jgi:hypothetical protein